MEPVWGRRRRVGIKRMKLLAVADRESEALWDYYTPDKLQGVDLILSCGDLSPEYLEFLVTMASCPLLYVRGNHDGRYDRRPPSGCIDVDGRVYEHKGLRVFGLGGSMRYREGKDMYTEQEMKREIRRARGQITASRGFDILLTHSPARGWGDMEDLPHRGFSCFNDLLERYHPMYMIHGHVHSEYGHFVREREHDSGTQIINAFGRTEIEISEENLPMRHMTRSALFDLYLRLTQRKFED